MEDGWRWKAGSQDHRSCQLEICHNLFLPSRHSAKLLARQRSCLNRKSQVPETDVLHFTAMCCLQQTLTSSRIRSCETCQVPSVFLLGNYSYGLNWSCPNLSCMVQQFNMFNAAHLSAICPSAPSVSSPLPELLVEEGWASHARSTEVNLFRYFTMGACSTIINFLT